MDDKTLALLGDHEAAERLTEAGVLLPCPFCGENSVILSNWGMWRCWCQNCGGKSDDSLSRAEAVKNWNHRAPILTPNQLAALRLMEEPRVFEEAKK